MGPGRAGLAAEGTDEGEGRKEMREEGGEDIHASTYIPTHTSNN